MVRPILIDSNPILNKCSGCCNVLSPKICVSKETKEIVVKAFNMITNKNENKTMRKHTFL